MEVPNCPNCGAEMVERSGKYGDFWGCPKYPKCRGTRPRNDKPTFGKKEVKEFTPSKYQEAIFEFVKSGKGNAVVEAVAGSGKTTTIIEALKFTPEDARVAFVAFNRAIALELADRAPQHVQVRTLHSLGLKNYTDWLGAKPQVDSKKVRNILESLLTDDDWEMASPLSKAVSLAKATLTDPNDPIALESMCDRYGIELNGYGMKMFRLIPEVLERCKRMTGVVDFDDMPWLPVVLDIPCQKFDYLFVDECLPYHMPVLLSDGTSMPIGKIVEDELPLEVLSYDTTTKQQKPCRVTGWHKVPNRKPLVKVSVRELKGSKHGPRSFVVCTVDHKIWADGKWIDAEKLLPGMIVQVETSAQRTQRYKIAGEGQRRLSEKMRESNSLGKTGSYCPPKGAPWPGERGGNGARLPFPQQILLEALGDGWTPEFCIPTGIKRFGSYKVGFVHSRPLPVHYKIDIANPELKIAVEVDGPAHEKMQETDEKKDNFLREIGWKVVRVTNMEAVKCTERIVSEIHTLSDCPTDYYVYKVEPINIKGYYVYDISVEDCHNFYANGILVHNCQDLNKAQIELALRSVAEGGRVIAVGDRNQSIYGFRGADIEAIPRVIKTLNAKTLPLSISYRCPRAVVELAQTLVPEIEAAEKAREGVVDFAAMRQALGDMETGDMVLCRTNAPLVEVAYSLIRSGQKAVMRGRDIGKGLIHIVKKMKASSIHDF